MKKLWTGIVVLVLLSCSITDANYDTVMIRRVGLLYEVKVGNSEYYSYNISNEWTEMTRKY